MPDFAPTRQTAEKDAEAPFEPWDMPCAKFKEVDTGVFNKDGIFDNLMNGIREGSKTPNCGKPGHD